MSEYVCCDFDLAEGIDCRELEQIVRCRDCRYCRRDGSRWYCSELMFDIDWVTSDTALDGFCAWGERREDT